MRPAPPPHPTRAVRRGSAPHPLPAQAPGRAPRPSPAARPRPGPALRTAIYGPSPERPPRPPRAAPQPRGRSRQSGWFPSARGRIPAPPRGPLGIPAPRAPPPASPAPPPHPGPTPPAGLCPHPGAVGTGAVPAPRGWRSASRNRGHGSRCTPGTPGRGLTAAGECSPGRCGAGEAEPAFPFPGSALRRYPTRNGVPRAPLIRGAGAGPRCSPPTHSRTAPLLRC